MLENTPENDDLFALPAGTVPTTLTPAQALLDAGCTDREIADRLGLDMAAVQLLPELVGTSDDPRTARVERAVYMRAVGYTRGAEKVLGNGQVVQYTETIDPDPVSAKAWLAAKAPAWAGAADSASAARGITVNVTLHGQPRVTIGGQTVDAEFTAVDSDAPPGGLSRQAGAGDP